MAYTYGLSGIAVVQSSGVVGSGNYPVRVFDIITVNTANTQCVFYNGKIVDPLKSYIVMNQGRSVFNSNAGIRFPDGLFVTCVVSGSSCFVNYIEER
jgi:hypothetical protein